MRKGARPARLSRLVYFRAVAPCVGRVARTTHKNNSVHTAVRVSYISALSMRWLFGGRHNHECVGRSGSSAS